MATYLNSVFQERVQVLVDEVREFKKLYDTRGPAVEGIKPRLAMERQREFQCELEDKDAQVRKIRYSKYFLPCDRHVISMQIH